MATTNRFGFEAFGPEGRISDNGHKFTMRDRQTMDALFWTLFNHDHRHTDVVLPLFGPLGRPTLTVSDQGSIGAGVTLYYRVSYMDAQANETEASIASTVITPSPIPPPEAPIVIPATTGGTLDAAGVYRYALAHYQDGGATTRAVNVGQAVLPVTTQGKITLELPALATGADGWHVYRRDPLSDDYYYLAAIPAPATTWVDDGTFNPDCTRKGPNVNNTNTGNSVIIDLDPNDLPLDPRVTAWRIYRSANGTFSSGDNLLATITNTLTQGGNDLVTTYTDTGQALSQGAPLEQTTVPPVLPGLDAGESFDPTSSWLPASLAPQGVHQLHVTLPGTLTDNTTYFRTKPTTNLRVHRLDAFFLTAPTGANASNHAILRVKDDGTQNAIQSIYTDAIPLNAVHHVYTTATSGTFTLSYGGQTTSAIAFNAAPATVAAAIEALTNITTVFVTGNGIQSDPWVISFIDPYIAPTPFAQNGAGLVGGTLSFTAVVTGSGGGTFTLTLDAQTTAAINWDATPAAVATAIEALSNVVDVTVTGAGTLQNPWLVEFVNPGAQDVPLMSGDPNGLNGSVFIEEVAQGYGPANIELPCNGNVQYFEFVPGDPVAVTLEAEDGTITGGSEINDVAALNDVAVELTGAGNVKWVVGTLTPGTYAFQVWVAAPGGPQTATMRVSNLGTGASLSGNMKTTSYVVDRSIYTPAYDVIFTADGTENIELSVARPGGGANLRVDRLGYQADLPVLHSGANLEVEVEVVGTPTTTGSDVQLNLWY